MAVVEALMNFPGMQLDAFGGRLSLDSADPYPSADQTAKLTLYLVPDEHGARIPFYDADSYPHATSVIDVANAVGGFVNAPGAAGTLVDASTTASGTRVVSSIDATKLTIGMKATDDSGRFGASATIASIDSDTQVTLDVNHASTGACTGTFKLPASTMYDVYAVVDLTTYQVKLKLLKWTSATARATAILRMPSGSNATLLKGGGHWYKSGDKTWLLVGTVYTTAVDGQFEDSALNRFVGNVYNRIPRKMKVTGAGSGSGATTNGAWTEFANTSEVNLVQFVDPIGGWASRYSLNCDMYAGTIAFVYIGIRAVAPTSAPEAPAGTQTLTYVPANASLVHISTAGLNKIYAQRATSGANSGVWSAGYLQGEAWL